jgi:uncharacterized protein YdeI (YjbR/CyaY-like superfamily)
METLQTFCPTSQADWRKWLTKNHQTLNSIWLVYYKKHSGKPTIKYSDAVDEALCFGWIDSKAKPIDDEKSMQFFCKRKPTSVWSKVNKAKVERLIAENKMQAAGLRLIEIAKANGSWDILNDAEALIIPPALEAAFKKIKGSKNYFEQLSRTDKRNILQWLTMAKKPETKANRINEIATLAGEGKKPKQFTVESKTKLI